MSKEEFPTSFSIELDELLKDLKHSKKSQETFLKRFFLDSNPLWRNLRYALIVHKIDKLVEGNTSFDKILKPLKSLSHTHEKQFNETIKNIRKSLKTAPLDKGVLEGIFKIYSSLDLNPLCKKIIELMKKSVAVEAIEEDLFTRLHQTRKQIYNAPRMLKIPFFHEIMQFLQGQFNINYDPIIQENTPFKLFEIPLKEKTAIVIRMGTQTYENHFAPLTQKAYVTDEFKAFIGYLQDQKKTHLYFNFQNNIPTWIGRNEAPRCRALKEFSIENKDCLYFVTLPKNTLFYHQEGVWVNLCDAEKFKKGFKDEYLDPHGGFDFVNTEKIQEPYDLLNNVIEKVHRDFFDSQPSLTLNDRLNFIEITYLEIEKHLINTLRPDTLNFTCKDGIDRAGGASALYYYDMHFKYKKELTEKEIQELEVILFAPAILVKKRAIISNRFERFILAAKHLSRFIL